MKPTRHELHVFGFGMALIIPFLFAMGLIRHAFDLSFWPFLLILLPGFALTLFVITKTSKLPPAVNLWILALQYVVYSQKITAGAGVPAIVFMGLGTLFLLLSVARVEVLEGAYKGWMGVAHKIGTGMTVILLTLLYYLVFGIAGIILRLIRKDLLDRVIDPGAKTYWLDREPDSIDQSSYTKQY